MGARPGADDFFQTDEELRFAESSTQNFLVQQLVAKYLRLLAPTGKGGGELRTGQGEQSPHLPGDGERDVEHAGARVID